MIDIKIKGFDKAIKSLNRLEKNIKDLNGKVITANSENEINKKLDKEIFKGV